MKILRLLPALLLVSLFVPARAQDAAPEGTQQLLERFLADQTVTRDSLRADLIARGATELRRAIAQWKHEKVSKPGTLRFTTVCPDKHERPFWVYVPKTYDPAKAYPLVVNLHGGVSGMPLETEEFAPGVYALNVVLESLPDDWKENVLLLGCSAGVPETSEDARWWRNDGQKNILHMIRETRRRFNVDDDRIFVGGHSDGGSGSFALAQRRPDTFAGFFSLCGHPLVGYGDGVNVWLENLKGSRVYAVNGARDPLYPSAKMKPIFDQCEALGAKVDTMMFENLTHDITLIVGPQVEQIFKDRVAKHARNRTPAQIDWSTDGAQTGRREWLCIDEVLDLGEKNSAPANAVIILPAPRVVLGIRVDQQAEQPTVESVDKDTTAEKIGMKAGDVILKLDDKSIDTLAELQDALGAKNWGDDVKVTVKRGDKEEVLSGKFPKREAESPKYGPSARVMASLQPGVVNLSVRNAGKVSLCVTEAMLAEGKLKVVLTGKDGKEVTLRESSEVKADAAFILDEFARTLDRREAAIAKVEIDLAKALGVERK